MKVALIKPPGTYADWYARPVLGLSYISSYLEHRAYETEIFDAYYNGWSEEELVERIKSYSPDVIGLSAMTHEINCASRIAEKAGGGKIPSVIGGCHATALSERTLIDFPSFDFACFGEGEVTFVELLKYLEKNNSDDELNKIKGIAFKSNQKIAVNQPRPYLSSAELDALPLPAFEKYYGRKPDALSNRKAWYIIATSRGCPYKCTFCMRVLGSKVRRRSAKNILSEMKYANEQWGAWQFDFYDEIFLSENSETLKLLNMILKEELHEKIVWRGMTRANHVSPSLIALAKKSGCVKLDMGVESGDNDTLRLIGKNFTVKDVKKAVKIIKKEKIELGTYYILGHPKETRETVKKTILLSTVLNTNTIAVGLMVPYPGTKIWEMAKRGYCGYRLLTEDWNQYDKYGGKVLELEGVSWNELAIWQFCAIFFLYLRNFRAYDFIKYLWKRKASFPFLIRKIILKAKGNNLNVE